jgi:hypothetical protein
LTKVEPKKVVSNTTNKDTLKKKQFKKERNMLEKLLAKASKTSLKKALKETGDS